MINATDRLTHALVGRYRIERELGAGGMATVYLAEDVKRASGRASRELVPGTEGKGAMTPGPNIPLAAALADRYRIERELGAGGMAWKMAAEAAARPMVAEATGPQVGLRTDCRAARLLAGPRDA